MPDAAPPVPEDIEALEARLRELKRARRIERQRVAALRRWSDPEVRARMSAASKAAWADPEVRARMSAASKAALAKRERFCCPPELLPLYRKLQRCGMSAAEAQRELATLMEKHREATE